MKMTSKCASALVALLAVSTVGGSAVFAAEADDAKVNQSTGTVEVTDATDTGGPGTDGEIVDPEDKDTIKPTDPKDIDTNTNKGPIKLEQVSKLDFGKIEPAAKTVEAFAAPVSMQGGKERGAVVQFADVRAGVYGYKLNVAMTQQFTNEKARALTGSTITYNNGIMKAEDGNENTPASTLNFNAVEIGFDEDKKQGEAVTVVEAAKDAAKEEGKGRYVVEFGQSADYTQQPGTVGTPKADSIKDAVKLTIPNKTASNMQKGTYTAKVTWTLVTEP